jgi:hypothetical protein
MVTKKTCKIAIFGDFFPAKKRQIGLEENRPMTIQYSKDFQNEPVMSQKRLKVYTEL